MDHERELTSKGPLEGHGVEGGGAGVRIQKTCRRGVVTSVRIQRTCHRRRAMSMAGPVKGTSKGGTGCDQEEGQGGGTSKGAIRRTNRENQRRGRRETRSCWEMRPGRGPVRRSARGISLVFLSSLCTVQCRTFYYIMPLNIFRQHVMLYCFILFSLQL